MLSMSMSSSLVSLACYHYHYHHNIKLRDTVFLFIIFTSQTFSKILSCSVPVFAYFSLDEVDMDGFPLYPFSAHFSFHSNSLSSFFLHIIVTTSPTSVSKKKRFLFDSLAEKLDECFWYAVPGQGRAEGHCSIWTWTHNLF